MTLYIHALQHWAHNVLKNMFFFKNCIKSLFLEQVEQGQQRQQGRGPGRFFSSQRALWALLGHVQIQRAGRFVHRKARLFSHAGCERQQQTGHKQTRGQDSLCKHLINVTDVRSTPSPLNANMYRQLFLNSVTHDATPTPNQISSRNSEESCCNISALLESKRFNKQSVSDRKQMMHGHPKDRHAPTVHSSLPLIFLVPLDLSAHFRKLPQICPLDLWSSGSNHIKPHECHS